MRKRLVRQVELAENPRLAHLLSLLMLKVHAQVPVEQLRQMIYAYPTFHRGVDALRALTE